MFVPVELSHPAYSDEEAARQYIEAIRWPQRSVLPVLRRS